MRKVLMIGSALAMTAVAVAYTRDALAKYEEPAYVVKLRDGKIEVREYPSVIAAEVTVQGAGNAASNEAFRLLAGYIFGKNKGSQKIAMTVPVTENVEAEKIAMTVPVTTQVAQGTMRMRFFMPSKYSLESLPTPIDERIKFSALPPARYAVIRFTGLAHDASIQQQTNILLDYMRANKLEADGSPVRAFFNPPWTLPFLRRNEVWIPLKAAS